MKNFDTVSQLVESALRRVSFGKAIDSLPCDTYRDVWYEIKHDDDLCPAVKVAAKRILGSLIDKAVIRECLEARLAA